MAKKGASTAVVGFIRYEERMIGRIDRDSAKRRGFLIKSTKALRFTVCSIITRKRGQTRRKRLMN